MDELVAKDNGDVLVWSDGRGEKTLVIIDDELSGVAGGVFPEKDVAQAGLYGLFLQLRKLEAFKAVGYFRLPANEFQIEGHLLRSLRAWLLEIGYLDSDELYFMVDVYYGPTSSVHDLDEPEQIGDLVRSALRIAFPRSPVSILSLVGGSIRRKLVGEPVFTKSSIEDAARDGRIPPDVENFLGIGQPHVHDLTKSEWFRLRTTALRFGVTRTGKKQWAHHLPNGGATTKGKKGEYYLEVLRDAKEELSKGWSQVLDFSDYCWETEDNPWDRPPIRALLQFDSLGSDLKGDLSVVLHRLVDSVGAYFQSRNSKISLTFDVTYLGGPARMEEKKFYYDYLWFNVGALGSALQLLAESFADKAVGELSSVPGKSARLSWEFEEISDGNSPDVLIFRVTIAQEFLTRSDESGDSSARVEVVPLPNPRETDVESGGSPAAAYETLEGSAGAELDIDKESGALICTIFASSMGPDYPNIAIVQQPKKRQGSG